MPLPSYLLRRGAIYYWRRRLPRAGDDDRKARHLLLSLATSDLARARLLAAHLNVVAEEIFGNVAMLNAQQINDVFRKPRSIRVDNGRQFTSREFDLWAYANGVILDFDDARTKIELWRQDYNDVRPHSAIGERTPIIMFTAHRNIPMGSTVPEALN